MEKLFESINSIKIKNRPNSVPSSYRITYRVTQILLIINLCCPPKKGCSLEKLQIISDAVTYDKSLNKLKLFIKGKIDYIPIRYDPSLNRALIYALAEGLIIVQGNELYRLSQDGKSYIKKIKDDKDLYIDDKKVLQEISTNLTEDKIEMLINDWRLYYVEN